MSETTAKTFATQDDNSAAAAPNKVAVVGDAAGNARQIVVLGAGDGTSNINDGSVANPMNVALPAATVAALTPPSNAGYATAAAQATANTSLSNIDTDLGAKADASATTDTGTFSLIALIKRLVSKIPVLGQATGANSLPVVLASDKNVQLGALDISGNPTSVRTDGSGRLKISHGQPAPTTGTLDAVASQIAVSSDGFSDAIFTFVPLGSHIITFEYSPDSTDGSNGNWFPALASNQGASAAAATTATITTVNVSYRVSAPAAEWIRARVSTQTTAGSVAAQAITTTAAAQPQVTSTLSSAAVTMTSTTIAAPAATIAGATPTLINSAATTNATSLKASAGRLLGLHLYNNGAAAAYFKLYNKASAPIVGTDTPVSVIGIPPNGSRDIQLTISDTYATGIAYAITGGAANSDATAVAANQVTGNTSHV